MVCVYCISHIQNAQLHNHRACWGCPFCELACLGICKWWHWLLLGIFAEVARFWPRYIALLMWAYSKAEYALQVFSSLALNLCRLQDSSEALMWPTVPSITSPCILPCSSKFSGPGGKGLATFFPPTSATLFTSLLLHYFFVCQLIILVLLSWFGFNFPSCVSSDYSEPEDLPQCVWREGIPRILFTLGKILSPWWQTCLLQRGQILISETQPVLFFLFLCVCSADISPSLPPFCSPCFWYLWNPWKCSILWTSGWD